MANPEHLAILQQGVEKWNQWRKEYPDVLPDLKDSKLDEINLSEANLSGVNFVGAKFRKANLSGTNLRRANLIVANLKGACLSEAALSLADARTADLRDTDFSKASLIMTNFYGARLNGANFSDADVGGTIFSNLDLSSVKGLESVQHGQSSSIDIDTLYKSGGNIPEVFLRGCGLPENFITIARSLVGQAIEFYSCFISYSSKDQAFAERLYADLQSKGVRCWFAPEDIKIGDKLRVRIDESIRFHEKLLLIFSENSVASDWVEKEVETAMEKEREDKKTVLFPVRLDDSVNAIKSGWAADIRRTRHIGDFSQWKNHDEYGKVFERLLRDLKV